jgi:CHC2 zinc finger
MTHRHFVFERAGGTFVRERVPDWRAYADANGIALYGRGEWCSILCGFHDDTRPSMRVNMRSGGWVCMGCGAHGGDVLAYHMQRTGRDFIEAARDLGAWDEAAQGHQRHTRKALPLSLRDALALAAHELTVCFVVISDVRAGKPPSATDWTRFLEAARRVLFLAEIAA